MIRIEVFSFVPILLEFMVILKNVFNLKYVFFKVKVYLIIIRKSVFNVKKYIK